MIQRKQSIFLLLAALCMGLTFVMPLVEYTVKPDARHFMFRTDALYNELGVRVPDFDLTVPFNWLYAVIAAALIGVIFLYTNRPRQMRIVRGVFMVILGGFVGQVFVHQSLASYLGTSVSVSYSMLPGFFLPLAAVLFCWLAERGIRADEKLVKSMDRLR